MAKRMLSDEPDREFVLKTQWSEVTETICVKIQDFTEKIDDLENKKEPIDSPKFTLAGKELFVSICPEDPRENAGEFITVSLLPTATRKVSPPPSIASHPVVGTAPLRRG